MKKVRCISIMMMILRAARRCLTCFIISLVNRRGEKGQFIEVLNVTAVVYIRYKAFVIIVQTALISTSVRVVKRALHIPRIMSFKDLYPAPSRGNIKQVIQKWYPGRPTAFLTTLPKEISKPLLEETGYDRTEIDALYDQFTCLAGHYWNADPANLGFAIDRKGFDAYFIPTTFDSRPQQI